jgi:phosphoribosylformylglycinamidine cyclo-ligase
MRKPKVTYASAGVDLNKGDDASRIMFEASKMTWPNRRELPGEVSLTFNSFAALRYVETSKFRGAMLGMNVDGVGTKIEVAERMRDHTTIAHDLFAMVCDDAARNGAEPLMVGNILDCSKVSTQVVAQLANGMVQAAKEARVVVVNGEIAELGARVAGFGDTPYNWGAGAVWIARPGRLIAGSQIRRGDTIVSVLEDCFRSNGISLVRKVLREAYGDNWHAQRVGKCEIGRAVLQPSRIYTRLMVALSGGYSGKPTACVHGFVHVTGGGMPGKLSRLLAPTKLGALIDDSFAPCEAMLHCQSLGKIPDEEAYRAWNMGNGLLIVTPDPDNVTRVAAKHGFQAQVAGRIDGSKRIRIRNKGFHAAANEWLTYPCS